MTAIADIRATAAWEQLATERAALEPQFARLLDDFRTDVYRLAEEVDAWNIKAAAERAKASEPSFTRAVNLAPLAGPRSAGWGFTRLLELVTELLWFFPRGAR